MSGTFDPARGEWQVSWPGRISQYDIVYLSPPEDPSQGIPLGNGDLGALLWTEENKLVVAINKCDTWDDRVDGPFSAWAREQEERHTSLRHCARLVVDFGQPVFDLLYQQDFEARLDLAQATARIRAETPFAQVRVGSFASADHRTLILDVDVEAADAPACAVRLERWGSRSFAHWYRQISRDATAGLGGTQTRCERGRIVIEQELARLRFVIAAEAVLTSPPSPEPVRLHQRGGQYSIPVSGRQRFTVYLTVVTTENATDPQAEAHRLLDRAIAERAMLQARHEEHWRAFWQASFLALPQLYLANLWHLVLYLANSSSRGACPPHFCNGLWGWNRDFVPWNYYFHWNMQWYVWPLHAANHADLSLPYYQYRRNQLRHAGTYARDRLGRPGAFYADVADRNGYNDSHVDANHTPGPQIALDFWRHYRYTGDEAFLRESAWPVIREVTRFMTSCLTMGGDGCYHAVGGSAYEGTPPFNDTVTDLAMIRALLPVSIEIATRFGHDVAEVARWADLIERLAPFHLEPLTEPEIGEENGSIILKGGIGKGRPVPSREVLAVGKSQKDGMWVRMRYAGFVTDYYGIPDPEIAPVFPAGIVGLADPESPLFRAEVTQLLIHPPAIPDPAGAAQASMLGPTDTCMGWCPYLIALARLGLADDLVAELQHSVSTWQVYPQGFGMDGPYHVFHQDQTQRWRVNWVLDAAQARSVGDHALEPLKHHDLSWSSDPNRPRETIPFPTWPFRHFDNETMPIVATALNEMLLQSHEGVIRVCPATPKDWPVRFTLMAQDGLLVSVEKTGEHPNWVWIKSQRGAACHLASPWPGNMSAFLYEIDSRGHQVHSAKLHPRSEGASVIFSWETTSGHAYLVSPVPVSLADWHVHAEKPEANQTPRMLGSATLGRPRMF